MEAKSLAAAAAIMIFSAAGAVFSSALRRRCTQLELILVLLDRLSQSIRYSKERLLPLIEELCGEQRSGGRRCYFLSDLGRLCESGLAFSDAWETAAQRALFLSEDDRRTLSEAGKGLGATDTQGQVSLLSLAAALIGQRLAEARSECDKKARMVMSAWALCGIGAAIMII